MADEEYTGADEYNEEGQEGEDQGGEENGENGRVEGGETAQANHAGDEETDGAATTESNTDTPLGSKIGVRGADDDKKIFVGGLHWESTAVDLKEYFSKFGTVIDCTLKMDHNTGKSRGFGFVLFEDTATVEKVIADKSHTIKNKAIDVKRAQSKPGKEPVKKIFVGGLSPDMPESEIREYFSQYGKIEEVDLPFDKSKNQRRAFCFVTFETEEMADKAVAQAKQKVGDKEVDLRKATPKTEQDGGASGRGGRGGARGGGPQRGGYQAGGYGQGYPGYGPPGGGYDYSAYYGYGYGYPGYGAAPGYDYSGYGGYYGQQPAGGDWSGYTGYGYQAQQAPQQPAAGGGGGFKAKRGGPASGGANAYHPYSR